MEVELFEELILFRTCVKTHIPGVQFGRTTVGIKQLKKKKRNRQTRWGHKKKEALQLEESQIS